jgi:glycosyltransferase involved in cell wall biosynthesis
VKILIVDLDTEWRGGQNQALLMLEGLNASNHVAELLTQEGSALGERAAARGVTVHNVSRRTTRIAAALKIFELLKSSNPDPEVHIDDRNFALVHANEAHGVTSAWLARAHRRVPLVVSRRVGFKLKEDNFARARYRAAARILPISEWVAGILAKSGIPQEQMTVVYEGVEVSRLPSPQIRFAARSRFGVTDESPIIGCVGVLLPDKGQDSLIRAFSTLRTEFPTAKLLLVGDGPDKSRLQQIAAKHNVTDFVIFAGFVSAMESVYPALDLFAFPSRFEGLGTSLLSAMSYEIPSVAFKTCAFPEIIEHGRSGLLAELNNDASLANALAAILRNPEIALQIGRAARKRIEQKFSAPKMVDNMIQVYESLLASNAATEPPSAAPSNAPPAPRPEPDSNSKLSS